MIGGPGKRNVKMFYTVSFDPELLLMQVSTFGPRGGITFWKSSLSKKIQVNQWKLRKIVVLTQDVVCGSS